MPAPLSRHLPLRLRVWRARADLDARLAAGSDPGGSPELALRARQLLRWSPRARLAERVADLAGAERDPHVRASLRSLALRVSRVRDRDVRSVATASRLLRAGRRRPASRDDGSSQRGGSQVQVAGGSLAGNEA